MLAPHAIADALHQVRFAEPASAVQNQETEIRPGTSHNGGSGRVRKLVGGSDYEVLELTAQQARTRRRRCGPALRRQLSRSSGRWRQRRRGVGARLQDLHVD
jgi:hypothetical protein